MIILHKKENDTRSTEIEDTLNNLVLAFKTVNHTESEAPEELPYIEDSNKTISGDEAINEWIIELEGDLKWQRSLSGDACYIDPKTGKVC